MTSQTQTQRLDYVEAEDQEHLQASDELSNGPLRFMSAKEIRELKAELERRKEKESKPEDFETYQAIREWFNNRPFEEKKAAIILSSLICCDDKDLDDIAQEAYTQWRNEVYGNGQINEFVTGVAFGVVATT